MDKVTILKSVHKPQHFEEKGEPKQDRTEVLPLTSLTRLTVRPNRFTIVRKTGEPFIQLSSSMFGQGSSPKWQTPSSGLRHPPSTTAVAVYAIGLEKLSANGHFFVSAQI